MPGGLYCRADDDSLPRGRLDAVAEEGVVGAEEGSAVERASCLSVFA